MAEEYFVDFKYVNEASSLENIDNFANGDIIFCVETKKIYVKMNDEIKLFGGDEYELPKWEDVELNDTPYVRMNQAWSKLFDHVDINPVPRITTPSIISPANESTDINQVPLIVGSVYSHNFGIPMNSKTIQIATGNVFDGENVIVYESTTYSMNTEFQIPLKEDGSSYLNPNTSYYTRIRYGDKTDNLSDWSEPIKFTTMAEFPEIVYYTPTLLAPTQNGKISYKDPELLLSPPKCSDNEVKFDKAEWQISFDNVFSDDKIIFNDTSTEPTNIKILNNVFSNSIGSDYFVRARQGTTADTFTPWSTIHKFNVMHDYDSLIFGFRRVFDTTLDEPIIYHIDEEGNIITLSQEYFNKHPLYQNIEKITILNYYKGTDTAAAAEYDRGYWGIIPICYMKYQIYYNEDNMLVMDEWFSPLDKSSDKDWQLHPAFVNNFNPIYIQKDPYLYIRDGMYYASSAISTAWNTDNYTSYYDEKNASSVIGKSIANINPGLGTPHMYNIYEHMLIRDLMLAESKTFKCPPNKTWHNLSNIICDTGTASMYGNKMFLNGIINTSTTKNFVEEFNDKETGQILLNNYRVSTTNKVTITAPGNGAKLDIPIEGLSSVVYNQAPTNKTNFPVKNCYFRVKDIAKGYNSQFGFDIALLMIANKFEEIDVNDVRIDRPFGFPPKFFYRHMNEDNYICYYVQNTCRDDRNEDNMLGHCGLLPGMKYSDSYTGYRVLSKLCMYS